MWTTIKLSNLIWLVFWGLLISKLFLAGEKICELLTYFKPSNFSCPHLPALFYITIYLFVQSIKVHKYIVLLKGVTNTKVELTRLKVNKLLLKMVKIIILRFILTFRDYSAQFLWTWTRSLHYSKEVHLNHKRYFRSKLNHINLI